MSPNWRLALYLLAGVLAYNPALAAPIVGWVDNAKVYPGGITLHARMDTGAKTSSLRIDSSQRFTRHGEPWVRVQVTDRKRHAHTLQGRIVRTVKIKRHAGEPDRRPVIIIGICVGDIYKEVETSIAERGDFNYPLLVGRDFLAGSFFVDSGHTFMTKPACSLLLR